MTVPSLVKRAIAVLAIGAAPFLGTALPALAWDEPNISLACGEKSTITLTNGQSAASRFDNTGHTSATVIVFLDSAKLEAEGHALRHHFSSRGSLKVAITTTKVVVSGPECPPPPPPPTIQLPCNEQWKHSYDPQTEIVKGKVDPSDRHVYLVTVLDKKTLKEIAHYAIHGSCAQDQFRLTVQKAKGIIDVHDGPRGKKA